MGGVSRFGHRGSLLSWGGEGIVPARSVLLKVSCVRASPRASHFFPLLPAGHFFFPVPAAGFARVPACSNTLGASSAGDPLGQPFAQQTARRLGALLAGLACSDRAVVGGGQLGGVKRQCAGRCLTLSVCWRCLRTVPVPFAGRRRFPAPTRRDRASRRSLRGSCPSARRCRDLLCRA